LDLFLEDYYWWYVVLRSTVLDGDYFEETGEKS